MSLKRMWKAGACIALCSAMMLTSVGGTLPAELGIATAYADTTKAATTKTFTADQLEVNWGNADSKLEDGKWKLTFANQYDQVRWNLPEKIDMAKVSAVTFNVADQKVAISLKVYNGGNDATAENTQYGLSGQTSYTINPSGDGQMDGVGIMITDEKPSDASVSLVSVTIELKESSASDSQLGDNIIKDGDFASEKAADSWNASAGKSTIAVATEDKEIGDTGSKSYGIIKRDPSTATPGDCFSQDITAAVEKGAEYQFSFWAKLSDDYKNAPDEQRNVEFAPFYVSGGNPTYLGSYSTGVLSGDCTKTLTVGEWTKYTGTFNIPSEYDQVVIRIIEQGTNYGQGDCVKGAYCVAGVSMKKVIKAKPEIEKDIPDWKDSVVKELSGNDAVAGTAIGLSEITDEALMDLVEKHFNAVTFGNELKPDAVFNYQLDPTVKTTTVKFKGQDLLVPVVNDNGDSMDFSRADAMADKILEWNAAHPDKKIRIRGHVLVWHSQTQEWFFHEDYDVSKPYVDKETMNRRLEWYIAGIFDHFFGADAKGKYDGLFYGWDVVNEAVIGNDYRKDNVSAAESLSEIRHGNNSSWWHVYQSNEFIINAFKYANTYAPKDVELYYNDFGETDNIKCEGIVKLINDVKAAEGTRIDGFGMQGHYSVDSFSASQFKTVAAKYAKAAGKVQLTELDFQSSASYKSGASTKESEYNKMAYCHKQLFDAVKELNASGTKVSGITVWGVIEPNSWLHSQSNVGGGADGSVQCPLLFDGDYKAKPAYWAYVDDSKLQPSIQSIVIPQSKTGSVSGQSYKISQNGINATFIPVWTASGLTVKVTVKDTSKNKTDAVTVYVDKTNSAKSGIKPLKATVKRSSAKEVKGGYTATVKVPLKGLKVTSVIGMDVVVVNGSKKASFNDVTGKQATSSKYYAKATMKPGVEEVPYGTVKIDGKLDAAWSNATTIPLTINLGSKVSANAKVLWDKKNLYVYATVKDAVLNHDAGQAHEQDSLEVFIDENNGKTDSYDDDDKQYRINYLNKHSFNGKKCVEANVKSVAKKVKGGYVIEAAFKWTDITPKKGALIGLELQINDADASGKRIGTLSWNDETGMGWSKSAVYGTVKLVDKRTLTNAEVLKTVAPKTAKVTLKKGKTTTFAMSSKLDKTYVKKITYKTSNKSVATVSKSGKITAKKKGTATIKATVTLKTGKTKTVSMKVTVK